MHFLYRLSAITSLFLTIISCTAARKAADTNINGLRFIGEYTIPSDQLFKGTTVGGLSGIDYDPKKDVYYFISDDRSDINPIRFYTAKIRIAANGIEDVKFTTVTNLLQKTGLPFYNRKQNALGVPDPEGIRINHITQSLAWVSEGERTVNKEKTVLTDPAVIVSRTNGEWTDSFPLPANFRMMATDTGPRNNEALEALAFSTDFKKLYVGLEGPLYEDGPRAGLFDSTGWVRICQYDAVTKKLEAQWAYQIDPVAKEPISESLFRVNGVTDILAINSHQLLITERSFSTGRLGSNIRVYIVELNGAEDVLNTESLQKSPPSRPLQKQLLLDMDHLGRLIDNIEGATFGPRLRNGKRSLLFIADNNFSSTQKNQLLLFEVQ